MPDTAGLRREARPRPGSMLAHVAVLPAHMSFHGVHFTGRFSMNAVTLRGGARLWFTKATFGGERVGFDGANFHGGRVSFDGAVFASGEVIFADLGYDDGLVTRTGVTCTGGTVDWGTLPAIPLARS